MRASVTQQLHQAKQSGFRSTNFVGLGRTFWALLFEAKRPRIRRNSPDWQELVAHGIRGALALFLNGGVAPVGPLGKTRAWRRFQESRGSIGDVLTRTVADVNLSAASRGLRLGFERLGWNGLQWNLLWNVPFEDSPELGVLWRFAFTESLAFERAGFVLARCAHGDHWFVSDDRRRTDCVVHRKAGQMARWRGKKLRHTRETARKKTLTSKRH
jgi:hypothetical protein